MSTWGTNNPNQLSKKNWSFSEAKGKLENYCAYQERSAWEVRRKLMESGIIGEPAENLIEELIHSGFLDEERFARSFSRGKFKLKKWGKNRIIQELKLRKLSSQHIKTGISEIDDEEYYDTLLTLTERNWERNKEKDPYKKRYQVYRYLLAKGYEENLISESLETIQAK
jgi:regulatory protein